MIILHSYFVTDYRRWLMKQQIENREKVTTYGHVTATEVELILPLLERIRAATPFNQAILEHLVTQWSRAEDRPLPGKARLLQAYRSLVRAGKMPYERRMTRRLQLKPVRTSSGVAPVTVLTKPYPCPGHCIFCPDDVRMPKSYLPDEPGAMRAAMYDFDPFQQTGKRIEAFENIGHAAEKVELLILGGTWSAYRHDYQAWFVKRCLDAMNDVEAEDLAAAQRINEKAAHRNVGLVIETRPDWINIDEVVRLRRLGVTKVQLGAQSLNDEILRLNKRGHTMAATRQALRLLRLGGFKIVLHWMPNLFGATPQSDLDDFRRLWDDPTLRPDELKIYPTVLLKGTELYALWQQGRYRPYADEELLDLMIRIKQLIPRYCRLNRLMRDIPTPNIVAGYKHTNLRQIVQQRMAKQGVRCQCVRCREVRRQEVQPEALHMEIVPYETDVTEEFFLSYVTPDDKIAGFLRLSLPKATAEPVVEELYDRAMIREVHVYGPALRIGGDSRGDAQHAGLGTLLIEQAKQIAREHDFRYLAVIAAIGTREYYRSKGFQLEELYMHIAL